MVNDDHPPVLDLLHQQRINAPNIAATSFNEPAAHYKIILRRQPLQVEEGKKELAHPGGIAVVFLIIFERIAPSVCQAAMANKEERIIIPVSLHEFVYIPFIPGFYLRGEDCFDLEFIGF